MIVRAYQSSDQDAVLRLWQNCGLTRSWNDPIKDIQRKMSIQPQLFLVGMKKANLIATVMAGYDGHRGWLNYLAVDTDHQNQGFASTMVMAAEKRLRQLGCPKVNIQVRLSNKAAAEFYRKIGYRDDEVVSLGKRIFED